MLRLCTLPGLVAALGMLALLAGCQDRAPDPQPIAPAPESAPRTRGNAEPSPAVRTETPAWPLGQEYLDQSLIAAQELGASIDQLLLSAKIENLEKAQSAWRKTSGQLEQFHVFTRLGAVAPQLFQPLLDLQFNLSAWPIQPGYLDSYGAHPYSGIVFDVGMPMSEQVLRDQHGLTDKADATLGIYAMEFLLFGEQNNRGPLVFQPITALNDKYRADGYQDVAELPRNRRRELLRLQARILVADLTQIQTLWSGTQPGQLRYQFETLTAPQQHELLRKAAIALVTEQLVTLANQQKPGNALASDNDLWHNQQLADRLAAQLTGLLKLHQTLSLGTQVDQQIQSSLTALAAVTNLPPITEKGLPTQVNWQDTYTTLRELVRVLNPGEPKETTENSAGETINK